MTGPTQTDFTPGSIPAPSSLDLGREDDEIEVLDHTDKATIVHVESP